MNDFSQIILDLKNNKITIDKIDESLFGNSYFMMEIIKQNPLFFTYSSKKLLKNSNYINYCMSFIYDRSKNANYSSLFLNGYEKYQIFSQFCENFICYELLDYKNICNILEYQALTDKLFYSISDNYKFMLFSNFSSLQVYASKIDIKKMIKYLYSLDKDLFLKIFENNDKYIEIIYDYLPFELKGNRNILKTLTKVSYNFYNIPKKIKNNPKIIKYLFDNNIFIYHLLPKKYRNNKYYLNKLNMAFESNGSLDEENLLSIPNKYFKYEYIKHFHTLKSFEKKIKLINTNNIESIFNELKYDSYSAPSSLMQALKNKNKKHLLDIVLPLYLKKIKNNVLKT